MTEPELNAAIYQAMLVEKREMQTHLNALADALEGFNELENWVIQCGGMERQLSEYVIHKFAELQIKVREQADTALAAARNAGVIK